MRVGGGGGRRFDGISIMWPAEKQLLFVSFLFSFFVEREGGGEGVLINV